MAKPELGAILLAAGESARLGQPKQLLKLDNESLVMRAARLLLGLEVSYLSVVTGAEADAVADQLRGLPLNLVHNARWEQGMGTSIAAAAEVLPENLDGVLLMLCDQWRLAGSDLENLAAAWQLEPSRIAVSRWVDAEMTDVFGPPAIFPGDKFSDLRALEGDKGARAIIARNHDGAEFVTLDNARFDLDGPEDLAAMYSRR